MGGRDRGVTIVGALVIIAVFLIALSCLAAIFIEYSKFAQDVKRSDEIVTLKEIERLRVKRIDESTIEVENQGSSPSIITGFFIRNPDGSAAYRPLPNPIAILPLTKKQVSLSQAVPLTMRVGVQTTLGNLFWEQSSDEGGGGASGAPVPPGEPVYITFTVADGSNIPSDADILIVDGEVYEASSLPKTFRWISGETHSFEWIDPVPGPSGLQYRWVMTSGLSARRMDEEFFVDRSGYVMAVYGFYTFSISVSPESDAVLQGGSKTATVTVTLTGNYGSEVTISLSASGLPSGASANFAPDRITVSSSDPTGQSTMTILTSSSTPAGTYDIAVKGSDGSLEKSAVYTLTVLPVAHTINFQVLDNAGSPVSGATLAFDGVSYSHGGSASKPAGSYPLAAGTIPSGYRFSQWQASGGVSIANPSSSSTTATVSGAGTITMKLERTTATVTFSVSGMGSDASETVLTVDGTSYTYSQLPVSFTWDIGSSHSFSWASPVSAGANKRYAWVSTSGLSESQSGSITVPPEGGSVQATYKVQYRWQFSRSGIGSDATGTIVAVDGSNYGYSSLPLTLWWDEGSSHSYSYQQYISTTNSGKRYANHDPPSWSGAVAGPGSLTPSYHTEYKLSIAVNPLGSGTTSPAPGDHWYDSGSSVSVSAAPNEGYAFSYWLLDGSNAGSSNPISVTMNAPRTLTAVFSGIPYTLTVYVRHSASSSGIPNVTVKIDGASYTTDSSGKVSVTVSYGSHTVEIVSPYYQSSDTRFVFTQWSDGSTSNPRAVSVSSDTTLTAYMKRQYTLVDYADPPCAGYVIKDPASSDLFYDEGASVSLTAVGVVGYLFDAWTGDATGTDPSITIIMDAPKVVTANFFTFSMSVDPASGSVSAGGSTSTTVIIYYGSIVASKSISLSASGVPSGASVSFSPSDVILSPGSSSASSTMTISTSASTPAGTHSITVKGSYGGVEKQCTYTLTVTSSYPVNFYIYDEVGNAVTSAYFTFADAARTHGSSANIASGTYALSVKSGYIPEGYRFKQWESSGGISISNPNVIHTDATVGGSGSIILRLQRTAIVTFSAVGLGSDVSEEPVLTVDGVSYICGYLPVSFIWDVGSTHSFTWIEAISPSKSAGKRYVWVSSSGLSSARSGAITVPLGGGSVQATYKTQYFLYMSANILKFAYPVEPESGWFDEGAVIQIYAKPVTNFIFIGWNGTGPGSYTGPNNPAVITINGPISEQAIYMGWLTGWQYRVSHVIHGTSVRVTDYQVRIIVYRTSGTSSGEKLYVGTKCRSDFGDIRFTWANGVSELSYWIEEVGSNYAVFWVKVPYIEAGESTTIYVYYGNPSATTTSNGRNTMFIFEDFQSGVSGTLAGSAVYDPVNKRVSLTPDLSVGQIGYLYYDASPTSPIGFYAKFYFWAGGGTGADAVWLGAYDSYSGTTEDIVRGGYHFTFDEYQDRIAFTKSTTDNGDPIASYTVTNIDNGQWHLAEIYFWYDGAKANTRILYDGSQVLSAYDSDVPRDVTVGLGQMVIGGRTGGLRNYHYIGNGVFYVRKYYNPEPSHGEWGPEETPPSGGGGGGWLSGWSYRRPITISHAGSRSLSSFPVLVTVDTASLISAGKMRSDGGDIRFTDGDGTTLLSYWVESGLNTASTRIWVLVQSIPAGSSKTIYLYYGNPSAASQSSSSAVFGWSISSRFTSADYDAYYDAFILSSRQWFGGGSNIGVYGDDTGAALSLPFNAYIYAQGTSTVYVSTNGLLRWDGVSDDRYSNSLDTSVKIIAAHWDDLYVSASYRGDAGIYVGQGSSALGNYYRITWAAVYYYSTSTPADFEALLFENGHILFNVYRTWSGASPNEYITRGDGASYIDLTGRWSQMESVLFVLVNPNMTVSVGSEQTQ